MSTALFPYDCRHIGKASATSGNWMDKLLSFLRAAGEEQALAANTILFRQGERPRYFYWLLSGELRLIRHSKNGEQVILQRCRSGPFAEASAFSSSYHCEGVTLQPSQLLRVGLPDFHAMLEDPGFAPTYVRLLSREVRQLRSRCERLSISRAEDRVMHYLAEKEAVRFGPEYGTLKDWAGELGMTHETLYRTLSTLERKRAIVRGNNSVSLPETS